MGNVQSSSSINDVIMNSVCFIFPLGTFGAAVTYASQGKEEQALWAVERKCHTHIKPLPGRCLCPICDRSIRVPRLLHI